MRRHPLTTRSDEARSESADGPGRALLEGAYAVLAVAMAAVAAVSVLRAAATGGVATGRLFTSSDDAFYYFTVASRWARGEGSTFDGIQATNGYQPLWFWINAAVFRLTGDDTVAVVVVVGLTCALWIVAVALARAIARELHAGWAGVVGVAAVAVATYRTWFAGMEFALTATVLLAWVWLLLRGRAFDPAGPGRGAAAALGVVGAVGVLSRLDAAAVVAAGAVAVVASARDRTARSHLHLAAALAGPSAAVLAVYLTLNALLFDSAVPMSGRAKQLGDAGVPRWSDVADYLTLTLGGRVRFLGALIVLGVGFALILLRRSAVLRTRGVPRAALTRLLVVLGAAQVVQLAYYAAASSWALESWYYALTVPLVLLVTAVLVLAVPIPVRPPVVGALALAVALLVVARTGIEEARWSTRPDAGRYPIAATVETARWVDASTPPGARLAMGDWAGAFGFSTVHPVLQAEGLVASRAYLDALDRGEGGRFLADADVGYYVKIGTNAEVGREATCTVYQEPVYGAGPTMRVRVCDEDLVHRTPGPPGQGDVRVWRVTPETWSR